jgi:hypothetical protein
MDDDKRERNFQDIFAHNVIVAYQGFIFITF